MSKPSFKRVFFGAVYALLGGWASFAIALAVSALGYSIYDVLSSSENQIGIIDFLERGLGGILGAFFVTAIIGIPLMSLVVLPSAIIIGTIVIRCNLRQAKVLFLIGAVAGPVCWFGAGLIIGAEPSGAFRDPFFYELLPFFVIAGVGGIWLAKQAWFPHSVYVNNHDDSST